MTRDHHATIGNGEKGRDSDGSIPDSDAPRRDWYMTEIHECPVCGRGNTYRERRFTPKPAKEADRYKFVQAYDNCLEF